jgi:hypothetical protein
MLEYRHSFQTTKYSVDMYIPYNYLIRTSGGEMDLFHFLFS